MERSVQPSAHPALSVLHRARGWVLLALATFCFLGSWAVSSPPQSAPDDDFQMASIWCSGQTPATGMCSPSTAPYDEIGVVKREVPADIGAAPCFRSKPNISASCLVNASDGLQPARTNAGLYPRPFFSVMHWFAGSDVGGSVLMMRLFNVVLALAMFGWAIAVAEPGLRVGAALTWAIALVPTGAFFIPSTNATSWAVIGIGTLPVFLLQFLRGAPGIRAMYAALGAVAALMLATSARSDAAAFGGVAVVACVLMTVLADGFRARRRLAGMGFLIFWAVVLFLNSHIATSVASNGMGGAFPGMQAPATSSLSGVELWLSNLFALPGLLAGAFGLNWGLGWLDTGMPAAVGLLGCGIVGFVVLRGLARGGRPARVTFAVVALALVVVPLQILEASHSFVGNLVQPRYLYPLVIVAIMVSITAGPVAGPPSYRFTPRQFVAIAAALGVANAYALHTNIQRYASGLAQVSIDPGYAHGWWWSGAPLNPLWLWLFGAASGALALGGLVAIAARANGVELVELFAPSRSWRHLVGWGSGTVSGLRARPLSDRIRALVPSSVTDAQTRRSYGPSIAPEPQVSVVRGDDTTRVPRVDASSPRHVAGGRWTGEAKPAGGRRRLED